MSYYLMDYGMTNPGTAGWQYAPVPSWGSNPAAAGPPRVGVGLSAEHITEVMPPQAATNGLPPQAATNGIGCPCLGLGQEARSAPDIEGRYQQTSWGMVAAVAAGAVALGVFLGYAAGKRAKLRPNTHRRSRSRRRLSPNVRWSRKYKNQLPDSAFLYVAPGGRKVRTRRGTFTIPKTSRKLPYKNLQGRIDRTHLLNAIARAGQRKTGIPAAEKRRIQDRARRLYQREFGYKTEEARQIAA